MTIHPIYLFKHNTNFYLIVVIVISKLSVLSPQEWEFLGLENEEIKSIACDPNNNSVIYTGSNFNSSYGSLGKLFKSEDGGFIWDTLYHDKSVQDIVINPLNTDIIYTSFITDTTNHGIIKSVDGGDNWFYADSGIYLNWETSVFSLAIDPKHPDTLYAGIGGFYGGTLYKSVNGGSYWYYIGEEITDNNISVIVIDNINTQIIYIGTTFIGKILKSENGGDNWYEISPWFEQNGFSEITTGIYETQLAIDNNNTQNIYAGLSQFGFYKSADAGSTWTNIENGLTENNYTSVTINPVISEEIYVGTYGGGVFKNVTLVLCG